MARLVVFRLPPPRWTSSAKRRFDAARGRGWLKRASPVLVETLAELLERGEVAAGPRLRSFPTTIDDPFGVAHLYLGAAPARPRVRCTRNDWSRIFWRRSRWKLGRVDRRTVRFTLSFMPMSHVDGSRPFSTEHWDNGGTAYFTAGATFRRCSRDPRPGAPPPN